jgi:hypothetical protein
MNVYAFSVRKCSCSDGEFELELIGLEWIGMYLN